MLDYAIEMDEGGVTVPYDPLFDNIRSNHGFVDTRGRPDLASNIAECAQSPSMRNLLMRLAQSGSKVFSVGCDLGGKLVTDEGRSQHVAGGYIQILSAAYSRYWLEEYERYGESVAESLKSRSSGYEWDLNLALTSVQFNLDNFKNVTGSICIWFHAYGDSEDVAARSREVCIANVGDCLLDDKSLAHFA